MIKDGFAGVFVALINEKGQIITNKVTSFSYVHSEEIEDASTVVIELNNPDLVDHPNLQEHQPIYLRWGYTADPASAQTQLVYIFDTDIEFTDNGIVMTLDCYSKTAYWKHTNRRGQGEYSLSEITEQMAKDAGISFNGFNASGPDDLVVEDQSNTVQTGVLKNRPVYGTGSQPSYTTLPDGRKLKINSREFGIAVAVDNVEVVGKKHLLSFDGTSDNQVLKKMRDTVGAENIVVDGRGDEVTIRKRNFDQSPIRYYPYKKEPGYLLKFYIATDNKEMMGDSTSMDFGSWDPALKELVKGNLDRTNSETPLMGQMIEVSLERLVQDERLVGTEIFIAGIQKQVNKEFELEGVGEKRTVITYEDVKVFDANDTYVAVVRIGGNTGKLEELDDSLFWNKTKAQETINSFPPQRAALNPRGADDDLIGVAGYNNDGIITGGSVVQSSLKYEMAPSPLPNEADRDNNSVAVVTRIIPLQLKNDLIMIENEIKADAGRALNRLNEDALKLNKSSCDVIGDTGLISGKMISITNVGSKWSGSYYIHKVTHRIDESGYICQCELYKNSYNKVPGLTLNKKTARELGLPSVSSVAAAQETRDQTGTNKVVDSLEKGKE